MESHPRGVYFKHVLASVHSQEKPEALLSQPLPLIFYNYCEIQKAPGLSGRDAQARLKTQDWK